MSLGPSDWFERAAWRAEMTSALADGLSVADAVERANRRFRLRADAAADRLLAEVLAS